MTKTTHFGFEQIPAEDKVRRVGEVFSSVASRYDVMNDLMSFGLHRLWKRFALEVAAIRPADRVLDLAAGTGDMAALIASRLGPGGTLTLSDINSDMLLLGRDRLIDRGMSQNMRYVRADAEKLPFNDCAFDLVTIAFGLRNITTPAAALREIHRVLKPGGRGLVLEFSKPIKPLQPAYDLYSFKVLPLLGKLIAKDADSYRYLAESIRMHPNQAELKGMMEQAGFERCGYFNLSGAIVALHRGYRLS